MNVEILVVVVNFCLIQNYITCIEEHAAHFSSYILHSLEEQ